MCEDVGAYQHHDIQILEFAHHVWGLDRDIGRRILDMGIKLDARQLYAYRRSECERDLYAPFVVFAKFLQNEVISRLENSPEVITDCFWEEKETGQYLMTTWTAQTPSEDAKHNLCIAKHILELRHERFKDSGSMLSRPVRSRLRQTFSSGSNRYSNAKATTPRAMNSERVAAPEPESSGSDVHAFNSGTRKRRRTPDSSSVVHRPAKRGRIYATPQLLDYAIECLAATSRRWVTGLLIDTREVTACYFDRHMVACSSSFRFDLNPSTLALVLYAMSLCDKDRAGFDPHHLPSPSTIPPPKVQEPDVALPVTQAIGSFFDFTVCARGDNYRKDEKPTSSRAFLEDSDHLKPVNGEGNDDLVKYNVKEGIDNPDAPSPCLHQSTCFRVVDVIRQPDDLVTRGTTVYKVQRRFPSGAFADELYALKYSWAVKDRLSEIDAIQHLRIALPASSHDHIPELFFSRSWSTEQLQLPWLNLRLDLNEKNHQERVLRAFASKYYKKLWQAGSIENFKQAWLDCVEGQFPFS